MIKYDICGLCRSKLKKTRYYIDYHISKNTRSWETMSGLVENGEIIVCKKCAIKYRNIMAKMFKSIGIKNWLKTIPYCKTCTDKQKSMQYCNDCIRENDFELWKLLTKQFALTI